MSALRPSEKTGPIRMSLSSRFENIEMAQHLCGKLLEGWDLNEETTHWILMALREALANAIKHGNREDFGKADPYFGKDIGFYVFDLPWLHYLVDFTMAVTVVALLAAAVVHYLYGGIRLPEGLREGDRLPEPILTPSTKAEQGAHDENIGLDEAAALISPGFARDLPAGVAALTELSGLLTETDSPFLAPVPYRGKRNEPAWVVRVAEELARVRGVSVERLNEQVSANFDALFRP